MQVHVKNTQATIRICKQMFEYVKAYMNIKRGTMYRNKSRISASGYGWYKVYANSKSHLRHTLFLLRTAKSRYEKARNAELHALLHVKITKEAPVAVHVGQFFNEYTFASGALTT